MPEKTVTFSAEGAGYDLLLKQGFLRDSFARAAQASDKNAAIRFDEKSFSIDTTHAAFVDLSPLLPQPVRDAFEAANKALDDAKAARGWGQKLFETMFYCDIVGKPLDEKTVAVAGYPQTTISVARYNL